MTVPDPVLIVQTAFLGDVILTLPVAQVLRRNEPDLRIDMMVVPRTAGAITGHPDLRRTLVYDKRGADSGVGGFLRIVREVKRGGYGCAIIPHRSLRSALLARAAGIPVRVGFDASAGRMLFTRTVSYEKDIHEIDRNLRLLEGIGLGRSARVAPLIAPGEASKTAVAGFLSGSGGARGRRIVAIAPGTLWNTKRWPGERYAAVADGLVKLGYLVVLIGGPEDLALCGSIAGGAVGGAGILNACGRFDVRGSAELIRQSVLLICNDSAPLHLATAVGTPVLAIFGATIPGFGFGPIGVRDTVMETGGLSCRPCSIHGGDRCPIGTFECMLRITPQMVLDEVASMTGGE